MVALFLSAIAATAAVAAAGILAFGVVLARRVGFPPRRNVEADLAFDADKGFFDLGAWRALPREVFRVESPLGYGLACEWIHAAEAPAGAPGRVVVLAHGHSWDRAGSVKYALMFLELGWDAVIYDHRGCGDSGGTGTTMGYFEKEDLGAVITAVRSRSAPGALIGAMGESMGAATLLLRAAANPGDLAFAVADCPFSDLRKLLATRLRADFGLPAFPFLLVAGILNRLRLGFHWAEVSPVRDIASADGLPGLPLLLVHGAADDYVPPSMAREIAAAWRGPLEFRLVPGAGHAKSWETDREAYKRSVARFLERNGLGAGSAGGGKELPASG